MSTKKKAALDCCCGACTGCCLPVDYTNPTYPNGVLEGIPFCLSAPTCPDLDGLCGNFTPVDPTGVDTGVCGACGSYISLDFTVLDGETPSGLSDPMLSTCMMTPCGIGVCFGLECLSNTSASAGLDSCCGRLVLWIGTAQQQEEDDGSRPQNGAGSCTSWKKVHPSQCACSDTGFAARFPFSLNFVCDPFGGTGPCQYVDDCCSLGCAGDVEVVI